MSKFCTVGQCQEPHYGKGMCSKHYQRARRHGSTERLTKPRMPGQQCQVSGCGSDVNASGYCTLHYQRVHKTGSPGPAGRILDAAPEDGLCSVDGCERPFSKNQMCEMHARRVAKTGIPGPPHRLRGVSLLESQMVEFVESLGVRVIRNTRGVIHPMELDAYLPDLNLAFEFDGTYWHGRPGAEERDARKDKAAASAGVHLVRIPENAWVRDRPTQEGIIKLSVEEAARAVR